MKKLIPLSFLLFVFVLSCKKSQEPVETPAPAVITKNQASIISRHTSGHIGVLDKVYVKLQNQIIGIPDITNVLSFTPKIKGELVKVDDYTLSFTPSQEMVRGQTYLAKLNVGNLFKDIAEEDEVFEFSFDIRIQHFTVSVSALQWADAQNGTYKITGELNSNDAAANDLVEKCISTEPANLPLTWTHSKNGTNHAFEIQNINRAETESNIKIYYKGEPLGIKNLEGVRSVVVSATGDFKVLEANVVRTGTQYISLNFSERLDPDQDLKGLIEIEEYEGELEFKIQYNIVKVFPKGNLKGEHHILIHKGVKNIEKKSIKDEGKFLLALEDPVPGLKLLGKGVIMPDSEGMLFPFKAINLRAVDLEVFKIFDENILQYFQNANYNNDYYQMNQVGRVVLQTAVDLKELNQNANQGSWSTYGLDLSDLIALDAGALYDIRLSYRKEYAITTCDDNPSDEPLSLEVNSVDDNKNYVSTFNSYYGRYGYYANYYDEQDNPCKEGFYSRARFVQRKVYANNIGIVAKSGTDGSLFIACNDLVSTQSLGNVEVEIYDFQQQKIKTLTTQSDGIINTELERKPYYIVAKNNGQKGILALNDGWSLSLSNFDVGGTVTQAGLKGKFYAERGVWRPGDDIYLNFVLEDEYDKLPDNHPVSLRFIDPQGKEYTQINTIQNINGIYPFVLSTDVDSPTGNWRVELMVGTARFNKNLKIETVKPNRLKIKFELEEEMLSSIKSKLETTIEVKWLVGTPAKNAKANIEMQMKKGKSNFEKFPKFTFTDPTRIYKGQAEVIFDGKVDEKGKAKISKSLGSNRNLPGMMKLAFQTKAFEPGGDFSIDNFSIPYSPFSNYSGLRLPQSKYGGNRLSINDDNEIQFVSVDESGKPVSGRKLKAAVYRLEWRWWWDNRNNQLSQYNTSDYTKAIQTFDLVSAKEASTFNFKTDRWGRYLIRVCDEESGHCTGSLSYVGYPYGGENDNTFATMLSLGSDKEEYKTEEQVKLTFPSTAGGRALVSIENGAKVLQTYWVDTQDEQTEFAFYADPIMAPTVYAHVTYIQPHGAVKNELPIRMYGITPISIYDEKTKLSPVIVTSDSFEPEKEVSIQVSEKDNREMTYTLAVVDEGLLDLTRFKTPNLWDDFYAREALGVKTWDLYDYVLGSFGGQIERIISIGGDEELDPKDKKNKANRFEPVVQHFGPFHLQAGNKKTHEFVMPNYIGSVRVMVVAAHNGAYGKAEEAIPVKKPLMVLTSLPRVLSPNENMQLPISVFAMEDHIKKVTVTIEDSEGMVDFPKGNKQEITFSEIGEKMAYFDVKVLEKLGVAKFNVIVESGKERATQQIEIQVDNPNEYQSTVDGDVVKANSTWKHTILPLGMKGTNDAVLEVSSVPPLNLDKRIKYLLRYPHGCLEQTTSAAFPLLYLDRFVELTDKQKKQREFYINEAINKISNYVKTNGAFAYWPGRYVHHWANNYAGHFLLEADKLGFAVSQSVLKNWLSFQKNEANQYQVGGQSSRYRDLTQAYRLYTLALAGQAELGAMNRLRQSTGMRRQTAWRLAAAYAVASRPEVAKSIFENLPVEAEEYRSQLAFNFGSTLRDEGMLLETLALIGDRESAFKVLTSISKRLSSQAHYNTHALSFAMLGAGKFLSERSNDNFSFKYGLGNQAAINMDSNKPFMSIQIDPDAMNSQVLNIENTSGSDLFVRLISTGKPTMSKGVAIQDHLKMTVRYLDGAGKEIDISALDQSSDIIAELKVVNPGTLGISYQNLALTQVFPSGWEVINDRLASVDNKFNSASFSHQDIRDDRIHTYFDLGIKKSKTFYTRLTATYQGNYFLPNQTCKAMYDESIQAVIPGQLVSINKS